MTWTGAVAVVACEQDCYGTSKSIAAIDESASEETFNKRLFRRFASLEDLIRLGLRLFRSPREPANTLIPLHFVGEELETNSLRGEDGSRLTGPQHHRAPRYVHLTKRKAWGRGSFGMLTP